MTSPSIPAAIAAALERAHPSWHPALRAGLEAIEAATPGYLAALADDHYLPTEQRLFAAFAQPLANVKFVLVGEGPYPRAESATGVCFMDGAVGDLWCSNGLAKPVNKATSLRNFMKMLLVADGLLHPDKTGGEALAPIASRAAEAGLVRTLAELQDNLIREGFLLLNASLVFRPTVAPVVDARAWQPLLQAVLAALAQVDPPPTLILWGRIAEQLQRLPETAGFPQVLSEHPFNLSFIRHAGMQGLFGPMRLLRSSRSHQSA
ncbi:MAG: uracil-DNA glycosylase [Gammaproteobacteria bacterium]